MKSIYITTGDRDGIGLEVAVKALNSIGVKRGVKFILAAHPNDLRKWRPLLKDFSLSTNLEIFESKEAPAKWVDLCARKCLKNSRSEALVTGPLSKTGIQGAGFHAIGHTELLGKLSRSKDLFQVYLGSKMNVLLATDHIPLESVAHSLLKGQRLKKAIRTSLSLSQKLRIQGKLGLLALDPHGGEEGLIGNQDQRHDRLLKSLKGSRRILGPLPADSAFSEKMRKKIGLYIALYHDQGLIPFKTLHGFGEGVHLTAGLPFVRTSVDHGTGKDLFGKNMADPGSMRDAILTAIKLVGK